MSSTKIIRVIRKEEKNYFNIFFSQPNGFIYRILRNSLLNAFSITLLTINLVLVEYNIVYNIIYSAV